MAGQEFFDQHFAFQRIERTVGEDNPSTGFYQGQRALEQSVLNLGQLFDVRRAFGPEHIGMAANGAGRGAGGIEQDRIEAFFGLEFLQARLLEIGLEPQPGEIGGEPLEPACGLFDSGHVSPLDNQLRCLAASGDGDRVTEQRAETLLQSGDGAVT